jgi:hypothetical protein
VVWHYRDLPFGVSSVGGYFPRRFGETTFAPSTGGMPNCDAVTMIDVVHHIPPEARAASLKKRRKAPAGRIFDYQGHR